MAKEFTWWEVYDVTSREGWDNNWNDNRELLGRYSTKEYGLARLKKWAEDKGINFDENFYEDEIIGYYDYDDETGNTTVERKSKIYAVGLFYKYEFVDGEKQCTFSDQWDYGTYAALHQEVMKLDEDI